ncbi:MAG: DUF4387 family protein [Pseudomonadota bacterium]
MSGRTVGDLASSVRSKNAGPFWLTIDLFFAEREQYETVAHALAVATVAERMGADPAAVKRYALDDLLVLKFSLPRPSIQGTRADRDMHGAAYACLIAEIPVAIDS